MFTCFMVFASLGYFALEDENGNNRATIGYVMIVFACLFIAAFASTWVSIITIVFSNTTLTFPLGSNGMGCHF